MDCTAYEELLSAFADGQLGQQETEQLQAHLAGCQACRDRLEELQLLNASLLTLEEEPPARVPDGIMTGLYSRKKRHFAFGPASLIAAACAVFILLTSYGKISLPFGGSGSSASATAGRSEAAAAEEPAEEADAASASAEDGTRLQAAFSAPVSEETGETESAGEETAEEAAKSVPMVGAAAPASASEETEWAECLDVYGADESTVAALQDMTCTEQEDGSLLYALTAAQVEEIYESELKDSGLTCTVTVYGSDPADGDPACIILHP